MASNPKLDSLDTRICRLCRRDEELQNSHVIPAFVFRHQKKNSATGHIRFSEMPNRRVQDGLKLKWLCRACEQRFSACEREFANRVITPWDAGDESTKYKNWLLKFCVSVSWRVLLFAKGQNPEHRYTEAEEQSFCSAEQTWREFLLDERPHPGRFEQHLLIWDVANSTNVPDLPSNFNRFMMGSVMLDIVGSSKASYVWSKLGRFQIFGVVENGPNKWGGTKIHVRDGVLKPGTFIVPAGILDLYREKAALQAKAHEQISDDQFEKIDDLMMSDVDRLLGSQTWRAMQADAEMFGRDVIVRGSKPNPRDI